MSAMYAAADVMVIPAAEIGRGIRLVRGRNVRKTQVACQLSIFLRWKKFSSRGLPVSRNKFAEPR